ncbi:glutamate synthase large subunit [Membranihabitans maritimus]|uniref:glutamate synthase large subunit n=1 Tax=Membranihabitans maritimus TaxID=2904244 RepID=UPI001F010A95|nr:glutamate synthase large subunit [Membranihabitans maritimus]
MKGMKQSEQGLYRPQMEKDSCGTGLIANLKGNKTHQLVLDALSMLSNMEHRGAIGADPGTGDGAGILLQNPHDFFVKKCKELSIDLPEFGQYGVGMLFFPRDKNLREQCRVLFNDYIDEAGFELLGYRKVPVDNEMIGEGSKSVEPRIEQVFVKPKDYIDPKTLERKLYILRKFTGHNIWQTYPQTMDEFYICSLSYKTIIYKGQLTTFQVKQYFLDLSDSDFKSAIALIHSRFSTNTIPKWRLAQPFRYIAHNGEINTIQGNINWWQAREQILESNVFSENELDKMKPIIWAGLSDSGSFDNVLEFLVLNGYSLPHALMLMIPEAWEHDPHVDDYKKAFYEYSSQLMEPWDGPASICFTDGILVGATLDRNGLRPSRYCLTEDDTLVVASEAGALQIDPAKVVYKGRLQPGKMLIADMEVKKIIGDDELKKIICKRLPYRDWLDANTINLEELNQHIPGYVEFDSKTLLRKQKLHGLTREDINFLLEPMIHSKKDPIGSMGADIPLAVLSSRAQHISNYFKQLFAQVTNPPIDSIRERSVMSLKAKLGKSGNVLQPSEELAKFIRLKSPVLTNDEFNKIKYINHPDHKVGVVDIVYKADKQKGRLEAALDHICAVAEDLVRNNCDIIILSDRNGDSFLAPIPSLLAAGAIHHHLIDKGLRTLTSLVVEAGDVRETHHFATLIGFGVDAINPYLTYACLADLYKEGKFGELASLDAVIKVYNAAVEKGLLKIMSKIGISTVQSYQGAKIFEILGLNHRVVSKCFSGTVSRIEGIGFDELSNEILKWHSMAYPSSAIVHKGLDEGGIYQWKQRGEKHLFNPQTIHLLQTSTRKGDYKIFKKYSSLINDQSEQAMTLRGLLDFRKGSPIAIDEVEPVENILKRFATGAMSFGSISFEAHTTLAIAMNRIGGKSNSGEGGEDEIRYEPDENGDSMKSATKQVASGRFGVTSHYLSNAIEIQIKMAQGAKPGEGGQLPGHKVDKWIARVRHSTPGVGLISPPPHHDIYSIEDLAQLIYDLKNANPEARINVKLVSKAGVGIIASGVTKAHADAILISGHDGGTGASPLTSISYAGLPWELGLAESHQTLVKNKLRNRVVLQTDGQIRTGRDLAIATLLGAEEWGIATAALVVEGCIMMRKCHLNTCPVGIATQDPELRKRFTGDPEHVINFFTFLAMELREIMAQLGFRTVNEMVGKVELLKTQKEINHWKYKNLDLSPILYKEPVDEETGQYKQVEQDHGLENVLDRKLIEHAKVALESGGKKISGEFRIQNTDRATGAMLSNQISLKFGQKGLPDGTIDYRFRGSAGQSFGAFSANGLLFRLEGESNDYFGKGLSGAILVATPDREAVFNPSENIIIGNVALYGATSGEAYIHGMAGERFAVRNSGVKAVVEGVGDHGCEYMTGGIVLNLGSWGKNFAAGMSGGMAFIYDIDNTFHETCNLEMVDLDRPTGDDLGEVRQLIRNHFNYTSSQKALELLQNWDRLKKHFIKVMPKDLKRVIQMNETEKITEKVAVS